MNQNPYQSPASSGASPAGNPKSEFANCPSCGRSDASKVSWTIWGGVIGPKMLSHVKCNQCGTKYNGKTGQSNLVGIIVYSVVTLVVALAVIAAIQVFI